MASTIEIVAVGLILALTTGIATGIVQLPYAAFASPISAVVMVIAALGAFSVYPAVGLALFLLTAILFFKRNVSGTFLTHAPTYGETNIRDQYIEKAQPHASMRSGPRKYDEFAETDQTNPMIGPLQEGFEPAPFGDEQGAPVDGQYPKELPRVSASPDGEEYVYRPDEDTGSNEFIRFGPDMDEKKSAFAY
jgi:hypothetical protein